MCNKKIIIYNKLAAEHKSLAEVSTFFSSTYENLKTLKPNHHLPSNRSHHIIETNQRKN